MYFKEKGFSGARFFFTDAIHMNQAGYCNIWTQDAFQKYLECEPETYIPCLPPAAGSIECICYEGNNCENDCTNGGVCTLLEDSRAPVCLLPSDRTTREAETEETTSESVLRPPGISSTSVEATSIDSSTDSIITRTTSPAISVQLSKKEGDNSEVWWMVVIILLSLLSIVSLLIAFYNWRRAKRLQDVYVLPVNAPKLSPPVIFSNMDKYSSLEDDSMDIRKTTSVSVSIYEIEEGTLPRSIMEVRKPGNNLSA